MTRSTVSPPFTGATAFAVDNISGLGDVQFWKLLYGADNATLALGIGGAGPITTDTIRVVQANGGVGIDRSVALDTILPTLGTTPIASGPWTGYVLLGSINANPTRVAVKLPNISGGPLLLILHDGTVTTGGAALSNPSVDVLAGGAPIGQVSDRFYSTTFKGAIEVYGPTSGVIVPLAEE